MNKLSLLGSALALGAALAGPVQAQSVGCLGFYLAYSKDAGQQAYAGAVDYMQDNYAVLNQVRAAEGKAPVPLTQSIMDGIAQRCAAQPGAPAATVIDAMFADQVRMNNMMAQLGAGH